MKKIYTGEKNGGSNKRILQILWKRIYGRWNAASSANMQQLDQFIRDIWVECCGHLSAFECNGIQYESDPDPYWDEDSKNMNYRLKDVVEVGDSISYAYDFGSTTELILNIHSCRDGEKKDNEVVILSRNNPPKIMCSNCEQNEAKWINPMGYDDGFFWCDKCFKENQENEDLEPEYFLPICNSPRMGICGYDGSQSASGACPRQKRINCDML